MNRLLKVTYSIMAVTKHDSYFCQLSFTIRCQFISGLDGQRALARVSRRGTIDGGGVAKSRGGDGGLIAS